MKRVAQITSYHCSAAVVQMLGSYIGEEVAQKSVVEAVPGVEKRMMLHGMTVPEISKAVSFLMPDMAFWYKNESTLGEVSEIVNRFMYPVGVEWQGVFDWPDDDEEENDNSDYGNFEDEDPGHYSVVTSIDTVNNVITLADPEKHYAKSDRKFSILEFENRWWDENEIEDPETGRKSTILDKHMMFIIVPKVEKFPEYLGMIKGS